MVNRVLKAKALKRMRQIRALPRRLNEDVIGEFIPDNKVRPIPTRYLAEGMKGHYPPNKQVLQNYRNSANSLKYDIQEEEELILRIYGRMFIGTPGGRKEALEHLARLQAVSESLQSFTFLLTSVHRARVFFNPAKTKWIISYENYKEGLIRTSIPYMSSKKNIIDDFRNGKLIWVEFGECSRSPRRSSG